MAKVFRSLQFGVNMLVLVHHVQGRLSLHHRNASRAFQRFGGHVAAAPQDLGFVFAHQQITDAVGHDGRTSTQRGGELDLKGFSVCGLVGFLGDQGGKGELNKKTFLC